MNRVLPIINITMPALIRSDHGPAGTRLVNQRAQTTAIAVMTMVMINGIIIRRDVMVSPPVIVLIL